MIGRCPGSGHEGETSFIKGLAVCKHCGRRIKSGAAGKLAAHKTITANPSPLDRSRSRRRL